MSTDKTYNFKVGDWIIITDEEKSLYNGIRYSGWVGQIIQLDHMYSSKYFVNWLASTTTTGWADDKWIRLASPSEVLAAKLTGGICPLN